MILKRFIIICISILFISCTSVKLTTVKNDEKNILDVSGYIVFCNFADIGLRSNLENKIVNEFTKRNISAKASIELFPPVREYSYAEMRDKSLGQSMNARIVFTTIDSTTETAYIPIYGVILPASSTYYSFDISVQDFNDNQLFMHSTLNTETDSIDGSSSDISKGIVLEILSLRSKELISEIQTMANGVIEIKPISDTDYQVTGKAQLGELKNSDGMLVLILPKSFSTVEDSKNLAVPVESYNIEKEQTEVVYKIQITDRNNLQYVINLLKQYDELLSKQ